MPLAGPLDFGSEHQARSIRAGGRRAQKTTMSLGGALGGPLTAYIYDWNMLPIGQQFWEKEFESYTKFPPLQAPATYNLTGILDAMKKPVTRATSATTCLSATKAGGLEGSPVSNGSRSGASRMPTNERKRETYAWEQIDFGDFRPCAPSCRPAPRRCSRRRTLLAAAGFTLVPANTPQRQASLASLPPHKFARQVRNNVVVYIYADPTICDCLYVGNQAAYDRYRQEVFAEEFSQRAADDRSDQRDELGSLG